MGFEELVRLNTEVCALQKEMHSTMLRSSLLLPAAGPEMKSRIFGVATEYLLETATDLPLASPPPSGHWKVGQLFPWLPVEDAFQVALCDVRTAAVRLAALIDVKALASMLTEQLLPLILVARPVEEEESL